MKFNYIRVGQAAKNALYVATSASLVLMITYFLMEPMVTRGAVDDDQFIVTQEITAEISFTTTANNITMDGSIAGGITGGEADGQTQVVVTTNNNAGYNMTIDFASSSYGTAAMNRNGGGGVIADYVPTSATVPDFTFTADTFAQLGYTVSASSTPDLDTTFRNNGSACNNNTGGDVVASCWFSPSSTAETIVNRTSATPVSGATTTVHFRVNVPSNPSPSVPTGFYTATATLTATTN